MELYTLNLVFVSFDVAFKRRERSSMFSGLLQLLQIFPNSKHWSCESEQERSVAWAVVWTISTSTLMNHSMRICGIQEMISLSIIAIDCTTTYRQSLGMYSNAVSSFFPSHFQSSHAAHMFLSPYEFRFVAEKYFLVQTSLDQCFREHQQVKTCKRNSLIKYWFYVWFAFFIFFCFWRLSRQMFWLLD